MESTPPTTENDVKSINKYRRKSVEEFRKLLENYLSCKPHDYMIGILLDEQQFSTLKSKVLLESGNGDAPTLNTNQLINLALQELLSMN